MGSGRLDSSGPFRPLLMSQKGRSDINTVDSVDAGV